MTVDSSEVEPARMDTIEHLARHVVDTRFEAFSTEARDAGRVFILDTLGVAIAGSAGPFVRELTECARLWGAGEEAAVWGSPNRLPAPAAAMVNAYQAHNSEFDAIHEAAVVHPLASILGALLAQAERGSDLSGKDLLAAAILGVDVSCSIGMGAAGTLRFFRPATAGAFGALAALARARGFERERLLDAFGILLGLISGTMQAHHEGSALLGMQLGFCTRAAMMAADMAAVGLTGPRQVLDGDYGYYALFEAGGNPDRVLARLGEDWRITGMSHKPFPSGRATHGVVDALLTLKAQHGFSASDVKAIRAEVPPLVRQLTGRPIIDDLAPNYARLCIPYVGAVALLTGAVTIEDFRPERLRDPAVHVLGQRFTVAVNDVGDPNALVPQRLVVRLVDGSEHALDLDAVIGSPARPLGRDRHLDKFRHNWARGATPLDPTAGEALVALVDGLEAVDDCRAIVRLLTSPA